MNSRRKIILGAALLILFIIFSIFVAVKTQTYLHKLQDWILQFGALIPFILILMHIIETLIPPIPSAIPSIMAGFLYGSFYGWLLNWFADTLAAVFVFILARKLGKRYVNRIINNEKYKFYLKIIEKYGVEIVIISRFIPYFHIDIVSIVMAFTNIRLSRFLLAFAVGAIIPNFWLAAIGDSAFGFKIPLVIISFILIFLIYTILYKRGTFTNIRKDLKENRP